MSNNWPAFILFSFSCGLELWDVGQLITENSANENAGTVLMAVSLLIIVEALFSERPEFSYDQAEQGQTQTG